jgi:hypothetical protein
VPNRMLREGIVESRKMAQVSDSAKVLYYKLMSVADDFGRFEADPELLRRRLYMWEIERISADGVSRWLNECELAGLLETYPGVGKEFAGKRYLELINFKQQQRAKSKYPDVNGRCTPAPAKAKMDAPTHTSLLALDSNCAQPQTNVLVPTRLDSYVLPNSSSVFSEEEQDAGARDRVPVLDSVLKHWPPWWALWSETKGTHHKKPARDAFGSVVTENNREDCFLCTASYVGSVDPASGYNPHTFLYEQAKDNFEARWPPRNRGPTKDRKAAAMEEFRRRTLEDIADAERKR